MNKIIQIIKNLIFGRELTEQEKAEERRFYCPLCDHMNQCSGCILADEVGRNGRTN